MLYQLSYRPLPAELQNLGYHAPLPGRLIAVRKRYDRGTLAALAVAILAALLLAWLGDAVVNHRTDRFDSQVRAAVHSHSWPPLTLVMRVATDVGKPPGVIAVTAAAFLLLWRVARRRDAVVLAVTIIGAHLVMYAIKHGFHRHRPEPFFNLPTPNSYSFPSGHALTSFCLYGMLAYLYTRKIRGNRRRAAWIGACLITLVIGSSRVYLGVHYPTDVIGGYLTGALCTGLAIAAERHARRPAV
jgi:membrane-associated phospholipid phosphatase